MRKRRAGLSLKTLRAYALAAAALLYLASQYIFTHNKVDSAGQSVYLTVTRVIDGDTLKLSDGSRVRLIGVDTPEAHYSDKLLQDAKRSRRDVNSIQSLGRKASSFTRDLCEGKAVKLEYDVVKKDRYGRSLAYVYLDDGIFINAKIIEEGYAQVMTVPPNVKHASLFLKLERESRDSRRGLWADGQL